MNQTIVPKNVKWIWCDDVNPNTYCLARGQLQSCAMPVKAFVHIVADSRYNLWINGSYVGQGPIPFRRPHIFYDTYDITKYMSSGKNVIAVLGNYHGVGHCTYVVGPPGILCWIEAIDADGKHYLLATDDSWKVLVSKAYNRNVPRRTWATAWVEDYDARNEVTGWQMPDFDDSNWENANTIDHGQLKFYPRIVPYLEEYHANPVMLVGAWRASGEIKPIAELTQWLDSEPLEAFELHEKSSPARIESFNGKLAGSPLGTIPVIIEPNKNGVAFTVDFGKEIAGHIEIEVEAPAGVVIDLAPAETLYPDKNRVWCFRKEQPYARRYTTREGKQSWRCFCYDGFRYLHTVVRAPKDKVVFYRLGALERHAALPIRAKFDCDDPTVNRIWEISCHTMRVGSHEVHVDCPTREQTSAWGDAVWTGIWAAYLTGDASALRHLVWSAEHVQFPDGQMPCYAFSGVDIHQVAPLYDYSLIVVWAVWLYYELTGDIDMVKRLIPVSDRVLGWYRKLIGNTGLIEMDCEEKWRKRIGLLFVDHPGTGWHTSPTSIDRRGISAALNFFFILALNAHSKVLEVSGDTGRAKRLRKEANDVRIAAEKLFYDASRTVYVDCFYNGKQSKQISQQTNALAVISGVCPQDRARQVLTRILDYSDKELCLCGTYFWTYLAEALCKNGMYKEMWKNVVRLWDDMARRGATTWWETFVGDGLDSLCHTWSSVPAYLILAEVLGVKPKKPGFAEISVSPQIDLLPRARGTVPTSKGEISIEWNMDSKGQCFLKICSNANAPAYISLPSGWFIADTNELPMMIPPHGVVSLLLVSSK